MSYWTHVYGTIRLHVPGMTQRHKDFIVDEVLRHLPKVTGTEGNMRVCVMQEPGHSGSRFHDEFGIKLKKAEDMQDIYLLTISAALRDRFFNQTLREFVAWLCRLSKRLWVVDILVSVYDSLESYMFDNPEPFASMYPEDIDDLSGWTDCLWPSKTPYGGVHDE